MNKVYSVDIKGKVNSWKCTIKDKWLWCEYVEARSKKEAEQKVWESFTSNLNNSWDDGYLTRRDVKITVEDMTQFNETVRVEYKLDEITK